MNELKRDLAIDYQGWYEDRQEERGPLPAHNLIYAAHNLNTFAAEDIQSVSLQSS